MRARIWPPARIAMQFSTATTRDCDRDFAPADSPKIDPLMGWRSSADMQRSVRLRFATPDYANATGIEAEVLQSHRRASIIRPGGYGENFATNRKGTWTHGAARPIRHN